MAKTEETVRSRVTKSQRLPLTERKPPIAKLIEGHEMAQLISCP